MLAANEELIEALQQYEDLERVGIERKAEDQSRNEAKLDRRQLQQVGQDVGLLSEPLFNGASLSSIPSVTPSPLVHPFPHYLPPHSGTDTSALAPPPAAPHGPRYPTQGSVHSRTPSPGTPDAKAMELSVVNGFDLQDGMSAMSVQHESVSPEGFAEDDTRVSIRPSAKALGKRKVEPPESTFDDIYVDDREDNIFPPDDRSDSDSEEDVDEWQRPVHYVYDAAAERTQQRIREGQLLVVDGVH